MFVVVCVSLCVCDCICGFVSHCVCGLFVCGLPVYGCVLCVVFVAMLCVEVGNFPLRSGTCY